VNGAAGAATIYKRWLEEKFHEVNVENFFRIINVLILDLIILLVLSFSFFLITKEIKKNRGCGNFMYCLIRIFVELFC